MKRREMRCPVHNPVFNFGSMLGEGPDYIEDTEPKICICDEIQKRMRGVYPSEYNKELQELVCRIYNFRCVICGNAHSIHGNDGLVIHHIDYNRWNSHVSNLVPMCKCHHDSIPLYSESTRLYILNLPVVVKTHKMLGYI
jgi:hypothetical protein